MLTAEWHYLVLYFFTEYCTSLQNIKIPDRTFIILFWKYLVNIRSEAWLNFFGKYINGKLFEVRISSLNACTVSNRKST